MKINGTSGPSGLELNILGGLFAFALPLLPFRSNECNLRFHAWKKVYRIYHGSRHTWPVCLVNPQYSGIEMADTQYTAIRSDLLNVCYTLTGAHNYPRSPSGTGQNTQAMESHQSGSTDIYAIYFINICNSKQSFFSEGPCLVTVEKEG